MKTKIKKLSNFDFNGRKEWFLNRCREKFGDKYDYSKVVYINAKRPVIIICPVHGETLQTPDKHLAENSHGCAKCSFILKKKLVTKKFKQPKTKEEFLAIANKKYNNKYTYNLDNYRGITSQNKIKIICPIHGEFESIPRNHIMNNNTYGCPQCGFDFHIKNNTDKYDDVILQLSSKHENKYIYPESNNLTYKNKKSKINIICPIHGKYVKTAQKHLSGQGCPKCNIERLVNENILVGGYCEDLFIKNDELKSSNGFVYYLSIDNGRLFKIGITRRSISNRIKGIKSKAKKIGENINIKIISTKEMNLYDAFKLEQKILIENNLNRTYRKWSTELFVCDIWNEINKYF